MQAACDLSPRKTLDTEGSGERPWLAVHRAQGHTPSPGGMSAVQLEITCGSLLASIPYLFPWLIFIPVLFL